MKKQIIILFLLSICIQVKAQNLQGKVVDEISGSGIPFVSVGIVGTNIATVSNENGDFVFRSPTYPATLRFSHVSYLTTDIALTENSPTLTIKLKPASFTLNTVTIDPLKGQNIIVSALEKANQNAFLNFYANAFYRQLTTQNGKPSQIYELFYDLKWNTKRVQGWSAKQSRFAELHDQLAFSLNNQSFLTFSFSGYLMPAKGGKFVNLSNLKEYNITVEKYIEQSSQRIAVISCKYKNAKRSTYYVNSTYYIGMDDSKIYRLENNVYNLPIKLTDATAKYPAAISTVATFNGNDHPIPVLESISTKFFMTVLAGRQEMTSNISSLLTVYKMDESLKTQSFETLDWKTKDKKVIESIVYDASFWKNNPIVKQTALEDSFIKMMESKAAFGTMINE